MSHFSTIKTKIKNKPQLIEALELLQYEVQENQELINPLDHQHEKVKVDVSIGDDIGFRLNNNGEYELVADIQTWKDPVPPKRFVEKVTQQYARMTVHNQIKEMGFKVEEEWEMDDNTIELTVTRWV
ncbi:hypothetical protein [uncultured Mediterranean phage]|nr:hypothetical protein [uncultured Mediterranean phage]|tara:strand:- start:121 stop:501 length:381 start_codon:yes stop_codon:yes gene_type:complete